MRLIDAEELPLDTCVPNTFIGRDYTFGYNDMLRNVLKAPTIDAVPVVRCWQCKHHEKEQDPCHGRTQHYCKKLKAEVYKDFFCSYGERKGGEG